MKTRTGIAALLLLMAAILASCSSCNTPSAGGNGKKVYADYHGVRYTRQHDGKLGRWEMYADTRQSATGRKTLCYNADLIDSIGRHQIAAQAYPQVGMQSNLDEDYIEYQILSAKTAGIDGFFIEWGFYPHENDVLLKAMQKVARKYDFEIGVNWCDGWLYYDWITKIYPEINSREAKTAYMAECWQYLIDSVFSVTTAPVVNGHPVFYHFGPGATTDEFRKVLSEAVLPESMKKELAPFVTKELSKILKAEVSATFSKKISGGFTIGPKDGGYFLSFTDETFKELISEYLRPATRELLFGENK